MSSQQKKTPSLIKIYNEVATDVKKRPVLLVPFLIFVAFEFVGLILAFLSPREPFVALFGPYIRTFWQNGETFLHYPNNFFLLPRLTYNFKIFLYILLGPLVSGMCVAIILNIRSSRKVNLKDALIAALKKYIPIFAVISLVTLLQFAFEKLFTGALGTQLARFISAHRRLMDMKLGFFLVPGLVALNLLISLFIQSLLIYVIPAIISDNEKLIKAFGKSLKLFKKAFYKTLVIVGLPMLFTIPIIIINFNISFLINYVFPESVLMFTFLSLIVTSLFIEPLTSISAALFYLEDKGV